MNLVTAERVIKRFPEGRVAAELYFLTISLILAFGILQTTGAALGTDKPVVSVVSCSMYPQLHVGDILIVKGESFDDIEEGDILVYSSKEAEVTVGNVRHQLTNYGDPETVETSLGEIALLNIREIGETEDINGDGEEEKIQAAIIRIDGQKIRVVEGRTYQINGETLEVNRIEGVSIPIVHRVVEKHESYLETKGDNNPRKLPFEKRVTPEQVHGTSLFVVPRVGGLKLLAMDLVGFNGDRPLVIDSYPACQRRT